MNLTETAEDKPFELPVQFRRVTVEASLEAAVRSHREGQRKISAQALELKALRSDLARVESELAVARIELARPPALPEPVAPEPNIKDQATRLIASLYRN